MFSKIKSHKCTVLYTVVKPKKLRTKSFNKDLELKRVNDSQLY